MGNESRFINHSCDPNLEVVRWKLADFDEYQIGLFALRDIDAKEELSYDYGWQAFASIDSKGGDADEHMRGEAPKQKCLCAGPSCTGFFEKAEKVKEKKAALLSKGQKKSNSKVSSFENPQATFGSGLIAVGASLQSVLKRSTSKAKKSASE